MLLKFSKMQGLGNDFVVIDGINQPLLLTTELVRRLADRHFGIGCDQLLVVEPALSAQSDFRYRIYNADGSEVEQCGNGARCFVRFVHEQGLTDKREIDVDTRAGRIRLRLTDDGLVSVDMGAPRFAAQQIPYLWPAHVPAGALQTPLTLGERTLTISALSMGNPHAVLVVDDLAQARVLQDGPLIEHHPDFPARVNVGFMQINDRHNLSLRVHERGTGETLACGTGACAAAVTGIRLGLLDSPVYVHMRGGRLSISWVGGSASVIMTGPARTVFHGQIDTAALMA